MEENIDEHVVDESSCASSKRPKRSSSIVWDNFVKLPLDAEGKQKARCKLCLCTDRITDYVADTRSGTSNMRRHIFNIHKGETDECTSQHYRPLDQDKYREIMSMAIIKHNLPFSFVEYEGIVNVHRFLNPDVKPVTRNTVKSDILKLYQSEVGKLKKELECVPGKICLTSDLWSSLATDGYLALTAHYVDVNWVLQKRILNFRHVPPPHSGAILAEKVICLLQNWGIKEKIFTLTLDNASYNDVLVDKLKWHLSLTNNTLMCDGEFFHIRCGAHVLNLIVHDGLKVIDESVHKIRECVKYVRATEGRKIKFAECITQLSLKCSKKVHQDVPTRWNSTYLMLESALVYRLAFSQLQLLDTNFKIFLSDDEWSKVERIAMFLRPFYDITTLFSGNKYPTSNLYFKGVWRIQVLIMEELRNPDDSIRLMAREMKKKFDKYWECYSMVLAFGVILDPRYKLQFVEFCFSKLDGATYRERSKRVRDKLYLLFEEYIRLRPLNSANSTSLDASSSSRGNEDHISDLLDEEFTSFESQHYDLNRNKSELDVYLEEVRIDGKENLDVLSYWKANKVRYPELALMARDILSIPITSVASESAFSIGGQIISKYRSSILPKNAEALVCTKDWLCGSQACNDLEELDLVEDFKNLIL